MSIQRAKPYDCTEFWSGETSTVDEPGVVLLEVVHFSKYSWVDARKLRGGFAMSIYSLQEPRR
jgi:hypothetical protein